MSSKASEDIHTIADELNERLERAEEIKQVVNADGGEMCPDLVYDAMRRRFDVMEHKVVEPMTVQSMSYAEWVISVNPLLRGMLDVEPWR